jgi:hypothetical protein
MTPFALPRSGDEVFEPGITQRFSSVQEKSDAIWTHINMSVQATIESTFHVGDPDLKLSSISCPHVQASCLWHSVFDRTRARRYHPISEIRSSPSCTHIAVVRKNVIR